MKECYSDNNFQKDIWFVYKMYTGYAVPFNRILFIKDIFVEIIIWKLSLLLERHYTLRSEK